jgi:sugar phosphate isomerase/epimerase
MKIGLETESCHLLFQHGRMNLLDFIAFAGQRGFDGVQINVVPDLNLHPRWGVLESVTSEYLARVKATIDRHGLYCELDTRGSSLKELVPALRVARALGASVVRTYLRYPLGRFDEKFMESQIMEVRRVVPFLDKHRIRLAFENHEYETSSEMINFITLVGQPDWVGLLCDTGNSMMAWEEPVTAVRAMAPYAFSTHFKDHVVINDGGTAVVSGVALGRGNIDIDTVFQILCENSAELHVNLEMCYPYCTTFKRERGTGGVRDLNGTFAIRPLPFTPELVTPMNYYFPHKASDEALGVLLGAQWEGLEHSIGVLKKLRDKYCTPKLLVESRVDAPRTEAAQLDGPKSMTDQ